MREVNAQRQSQVEEDEERARVAFAGAGGGQQQGEFLRAVGDDVWSISSPAQQTPSPSSLPKTTCNVMSFLPTCNPAACCATTVHNYGRKLCTAAVTLLDMIGWSGLTYEILLVWRSSCISHLELLASPARCATTARSFKHCARIRLGKGLVSCLMAWFCLVSLAYGVF